MSRKKDNYTKPLAVAERTLETLRAINVLATFNVEFVRPITLFWKRQSNYLFQKVLPCL